MAKKQRYIVHVDMDAFFAAIEQRDDPSLGGKPVIIGADPGEGRGRGVVSTCSYEARGYGIHSALPISTAYKRCPRGIFLPVDMGKYARESHRIFDILERFTPDIEPVSIDEAFMDITGSWHLFGSPVGTCRKIKAAIKKETGLTASVGLAPNMMTAKIASDIKKPDGLVVVTEGGLEEFLQPLPVRRLWGIGEKTAASLEKMGIHTIGDIASRSAEALESVFGKNGRHVWELARGIDPREVETSGEAGSISNEHTFGTDTGDADALKDTLMHLSEKVSRRLRKTGYKGRTVTLKIRLSGFRTYTRAVTLDMPTNFTDVIYKNAVKKLDEFIPGKKRVRLLGVKVSNLGDAEWDDDLFGGTSAPDIKKERIHKALDRIIDRFGEGAVRRRG